MPILKNLLRRLVGRAPKGKRPKRESDLMIQERFVAHMVKVVKGYRIHLGCGEVKSHAERRKIQSRMDRARHVLFTHQVKLQGMRGRGR